MQESYFDNKTAIVKDDLVRQIKPGDKLAVATTMFSVYAYQELKTQLNNLDEFRLIFTSDTFTKEQPAKEKREFYIPRLARERSLFGTEFEIKLRNELTQKAIATECANWIKAKARFKSFRGEAGINPSFLACSGAQDCAAYTPFQSFTTATLGTEQTNSSYNFVLKTSASTTQRMLDQFNQAWNSGELDDVTEQIIESIATMYQENAPELIYFMALYRIFGEFLEDITQDVLPNEGVGYKDSLIWNKLYDFQRDAALAIINKLETYSGCILADSVGLGKTFTALAVIKYFEARNRQVLVLCPKKLGDNWLTYRANLTNNPFAADHLRYDVLYHTDLSRERGMSETGLPIERINWGAYDLVVIDESHNFRNGTDSASKAEGKENRYQRLINRVILQGVKTKVLMLSATPVNNRFRDLRNQLALAYTGNREAWRRRLNITGDIERVFSRAQTVFTAWAKLPVASRTTDQLTQMLDLDFFEVLDQVTVARSRKHIQRSYDMSAIGPFPVRNKPISRTPELSTLEGSINYHEIYEQLEMLTLSYYMPSAYVHASCIAKYEKDAGQGLTLAGREAGLRHLMTTNLLKRLESSVHSFRLTLERILSYMNQMLELIAAFRANRTSHIYAPEFSDAASFDFDEQDNAAFLVGKSIKFDLADMDRISWERDISADVENIEILLAMVRDITPAHDAKLGALCGEIEAKVRNPINPGNKKLLIFTAFADTAEYLYEHVSRFAQDALGVHTAMITGNGAGKTNAPVVHADMTTLLACFSPCSKERETTAPCNLHTDIDILIATDCISEGQNLQDCDYLINYDIHWNPVRIVQRFGRIDRIGSKNAVIQLVNYWPDVELDEYIRLKARVEQRMRVAVMSATGDDDYINEEERGDLEYRARQLRQMREEVVDLEDVSGGVSITDLGLNEFRMDLLAYYKANPGIDRLPTGIHAVVQGEEPGVVFVLRNVNRGVNIKGKNRLHPFYLVHVNANGEVAQGHLAPKAVLDYLRLACRGKDAPDAALCKAFNKETKNGKDMRTYSGLLKDAVASIVEAKTQDDIESFFARGITGFLENDISGLDDFELICFLVVRPC